MKITRDKLKKVTTGENNGFYGKHHSDRTKEILRKINTGKKMSKEIKEKLSKSLQGHYMPDSAKQKISNATKKQWENEDFRTLMYNTNKGNKYVEGNEWNKNRVDIFHPNTYEHKRVFKFELNKYLINGFVKGLPPYDKRYYPTIKHCSNNKLICVRFDKNCNKWQSYINYKNKRYGNKFFNEKQDAIIHRQILEKIFLKIRDSNIDVSEIDIEKSIQQSLQKGEIILWC